MDAHEIEQLCTQFYSNSSALNAEQLRTISKRLEDFVHQRDCLVQCRLLLDRACSPYSQFFGANTLIKYFNQLSNQSLVSLTDRYDLRSYILDYLYQYNRSLAPFVLAELVKLYARLTKNSWFDCTNDQYPFQNFLDDLPKFRVDPAHFAVSLQILQALLSEMSVPNDDETTARAFARHRKICISFRDNKLIDIFLLTCQYLRDVIVNQRKVLGLSTDLKDYPRTLHSIQLQSEDYLVVDKLLALLHGCLTYDFLGTGSSIYDVDISDENQVVQMPLAWHDHVIDSSVYHLLFSYYFFFSTTTLASLAISSLVQLCSIRRSLLNSTERLTVLNYLTLGIRSILDQPTGLLNDEKSLHEFCRLIARLKANVQLHELIRIDHYSIFIEKLFRFTVDHLLNVHTVRSFHLSPNTLHYILSFWSKIIAYLSYNSSLTDSDDATTLHYLDVYVPQIVCYYFQSRVEALSSNDLLYMELFDNDQTVLLQQLDMISVMGRIDYAKTSALLCNCIDDVARQYQQASHSEAIERRLTFLVYALGGAIGASSITLTSLALSSDDQDLYDGEFIVRILQLMSYIQQRTASETKNHSAVNAALTTTATTDRIQLTPYSERLELAILYFFEQFRKQYIGDHGRSNKVYQVLMNHLGIADEDQLLSIYVKKLFTNLQYSIITDRLIQRTVNCFNDLCYGYQSVRKLVKLDPIQYFISNHPQELFPFLTITSLEHSPNQSKMSNSSWSRLRTTFYAIIGRMLMYEFRYEDDDDEDERIEKFMLPFTNQCRRLVEIFKDYPDVTAGNPAQWINPISFSTSLASLEEIQSCIIGLVRDLRGLCSTLVSKQAYESFFNWLFPSYFAVFLKAFDIFYDRADIYNPLLKFFHELTMNRQERLIFDSTKANAYLLFRQTSNLLYLFQNKTIPHITNTVPESDQTLFYKSKLKPIITCFKIIQACLAGNYVNFGVFHLYSDPCFDHCLQVFLALLTSIQKSHLFSYPKLAVAYFSLVETFSLVNMEFLANLSRPLFGYLLETITEGILSQQADIQSACCVYLDTYLSYVFRLVKKNCASANLMGNVTEYANVFRQILINLLNKIIFGECKNIYAAAKPLLGLILLNESTFFSEIKQQLLFGHSPGKQASLSTALDSLMTGIDRNLTEKNKESFQQNLLQFRNEIQDSLRNADDPIASAASTGMTTINIPVTIAVASAAPSSSSASNIIAVEELMTL